MDKKKITENWIKYKTKQMADKVPYNTVCGCNPANGGSGMCGCVMGSKMVDPDLYKITKWDTTIKPFTEWISPKRDSEETTIEQITDKQLEEFNEYLHMLADMKTVDLKRKKKLLADYLNNL